MEAKEVSEYLEAVESRTQILMDYGIDWKPEYEQELENIDKRLAVLRRKAEKEHERSNRRLCVMQEAEKEGMREHLQYTLHFLETNRCYPYRMSNADLADRIYVYVKEIYPNAVMVNFAMGQYIAVFTSQKNDIAENIRRGITRRMEEIAEFQEALEALRREEKC